MTAVLTSVKTGNKGITVEPEMVSPIHGGPDKNGYGGVTLTADSGVITVDGKVRQSGEEFKVYMKTVDWLTIVVTDGDVSNTYYLKLVNSSDSQQEVKSKNFTNLGWFAARFFEGDLDSYKKGGMVIPLGENFDPKFVISLQITNGLQGYFDVHQRKLIIYDPTQMDKEIDPVNWGTILSRASYQLILME